ncbi:MAG: FecR domain-containing protein [Pseudomonadota bacterium]
MNNQVDENIQEIINRAHEWRLLIEDGEPTDAEQKNFLRWMEQDPLHSQMYERASLMWKAINEVPDYELAQANPQIHVMQQFIYWCKSIIAFNTPYKKPIIYGGMSIASLMLAIFYLSYESPQSPSSEDFRQSYSSQIAQPLTVTLPDGSNMILGPASSATVFFSNQNRNVKLANGVAYFDVVKDTDREFEVSVDNLRVSVVGTEFNVDKRKTRVIVSVAEGVVDLKFPYVLNEQKTGVINQKTVIAGQRMVASESKGLEGVSSVSRDKIGGWRNNTLIYQGATLAEFVADANRYSVTPIVIDEGQNASISDLRITGAFDSQNIDSILDSLTRIHPITIDRSIQGKITLTSK